MAEVWELRQRAERCRSAAEMSGKARSPSYYLRELADHYDKQADAAEARETAGKPKAR
jgi:hypothetical protein